MSKRKIYTQEFKIEAVKLVTGEGYSLAEAAKSLGITSGMLSRWRTQFEKKGVQAFPGQGKQSGAEAELRQLRQENRRLKMACEILKKATAYFAKDAL